MTQRFGNYEIIRKIAAGGMAEVFLAKHTGLGGFERLVCIKKILPHLGEQEEFIKMFQDEARIAANVIHPNIAQIYDIGEVDNAYYIAMEYVRGEDLRRVYNQEVSRGQAMPGEQAAQIVMYVAGGLDHAHRQSSIDGQPLGIVHRDISPQNVLVSYDGHVKVVDFGVAKATGKLAETRAGVLKGKYSYMSPEQASGDPIDGRTDVFALGITLYEVTTGTRLFKRESEIETLHAVIDCEVKPPREINSSYHPELEAIVLRALRKDPNDRFPTAGDMGRAIERYLIERGYPTGASSLADYMHELFAEKLADDMLFGGSVSNSSPQRRSARDDDVPNTRALTPGSSEPRSEARTPDGPEDENTVSEEEFADASEMTSAAGSGSWASTSGWSAVRTQPESRTQTHIAARDPGRDRHVGMVEQSLLIEHQATEASAKPGPVAARQKNRPSPVVVATIASVIIALVVMVTVVMVSQRSGADSVPLSGPLIVDSEPRGAKVLFEGYGAKPLNARYSGETTPFTINEGVPVGRLLHAEFVREGFARVKVDVPPVSPDEVPPALFAELVPDIETNKATLSFTSDPLGATVYIGGKRLELTTPIDEFQITARQLHRIEIRLAGYHPHAESVYAEPGSQKMVNAVLRQKRDLAEAPDSVAEPSDSFLAVTPAAQQDTEPARDIELDSEDPPAPVRKRKGYLKVDAPIALKVYSGGRLLGNTPLRKEALPAGSSRIRLENPSEGFVLTRRVRIRSGETTALTIDPAEGKLSLQASPWAVVRRGDKKAVETPKVLPGLLAGDYRLRFECPDGRTQTKIATVRSGNTSTLKVDCREN